MNKDNLLKYCRYYKGEESTPKNVNTTFWEYEQKWVEWMLNNDAILDDMVSVFVSNGLGAFEQKDNTPITLKALLFNRYAHWSLGDIVEGFKKWYKSSYIGLSN